MTLRFLLFDIDLLPSYFVIEVETETLITFI